jgi:hypothetical protein
VETSEGTLTADLVVECTGRRSQLSAEDSLGLLRIPADHGTC